MQTNRTTMFLSLALVGAMLCGIPAARAAREAKGARPAGDGAAAGGGADYQAVRLFKRAGELLSAGESERGLKMMETILDQYPKDAIRFEIWLAMGRHYHEIHEQAKAIDVLRNLDQLKKPGEEIKEKKLEDIYVEALYIAGVCHFDTRQYSKAFSTLRRITTRYPNTVWANQAYYYIGMSHFAQEHWNKAIKALSMVGTFVDPDSPQQEFVEAGHRFYVKIEDDDLPLLHKMGKEVKVVAKTKNGDTETITCSPLIGRPDVFVGSIITDPGAAGSEDGTLQVVGGDGISVVYTDDNTNDGTKDVPREKSVKVVSSASIQFTLGTYDAKAVAAFLGQPVFIKVRDVDKDVSADRDTLTVRLTSTYKREDDDEDYTPSMTVNIDKLLEEEKKPDFVVRDEVTVVLEEAGDSPVHTGIFHGKVPLRRYDEGREIDAADLILECALSDSVVATYVDETHADGNVPIDIAAKLSVSGEVESRVRASMDVVPDALIRAKKEIVETEAFLELARIFKGMGLRKTASLRAQEGLEKVKFTIQTDVPIPKSLKENGFRLMWELYLAQDNYEKALAVCGVFNQLYPDSPLVGNALMGIARVLDKKGRGDESMGVLKKVLALPQSFAKPEAQFMIAEITERTGKSLATTPGAPTISEAAIKEYKLCAQKYPDSEFAGPSLGKVVDYHIETKDYAAADDLLDQIFLDYQDEEFLDAMLLKWVIVAYRMGNLEKARDKCSKLIFEYPGSKHASKAKETLQKINAKLGQGG